MTVVDIATQMLIIIHLDNETAEEAWAKFVREYVLRWGFPLKIRVDSILGKFPKIEDQKAHLRLS